MFRVFLQIVFLLAVVSAIPARAFLAAEERSADEVRVMSFNIRYGTADDGENQWDHRKDFLVETIRAFDPDLLGTQETLGFQRDFLGEKLAAYDKLGVGRDDGREAGEMMALYFKKERFEKLDSGHFWLSKTPNEPGSKSWDSSLPRMVTWVKLRDRRNPSARPLLFLNTHFDHQGETARIESARLLRTQASTLGEGCALVVTGDFNAGEESEAYRALFGVQDQQPALLFDTFRTVRATPGANEGTFSDFNASAIDGPRIDWIGVSSDWRGLDAAIDRTQRDGHTPSDHFPVTAILRRVERP